jgi:hypothetical protein
MALMDQMVDITVGGATLATGPLAVALGAKLNGAADGRRDAG